MTDSKPVRFKLPNPACPNDPEAWIEVETTEETRDLLRTHPDFVDNAPVGHIVRVVGSSGDMNQVRGPVPGRRTSGRSKSKRVKRKQVRKSRRANRGK
jgi:hypothetical protein